MASSMDVGVIPPATDDDLHAAALTVCEASTDVNDARTLIAMLGLLDRKSDDA